MRLGWPPGRGYRVSAVVRSTIPIMARHIASNEFPEALAVYGSLKERGVPLSVVDFNALIRSASDSKFHSDAEALWEDMKAAGVAPDGKTMSLLMSNFCKSHQFEKAIQLHKGLPQYNIPDDRVLKSIALSAYTALGRPESDALLSQLRGNANMDSYSNDGLLRGYTIQGDFQKAEGTLDKMIKEGQTPSIHLWNRLIRSLCFDHKLDQAIKILPKMKKSGFNPDLTIFQMLLNSACKDSLLERIPQILQLMKEYKCTPTREIFSSLIKEFTIKQEHAFVVKVGDYVTSFNMELDGRMYSNLIQAASRSKQAGKGLELYQQSKKAGLKLQHFAFPALFNCCVELKDLEGIKGILQEAPEHGFVPSIDIYNKALSVAKKRNSIDEAFGFLQNIRDENLQPSAVTYTTLIQICFACKQPDEVQELLDQMMQEGVSLDPVLELILKKNHFKIPKPTK